MCTNEYVTIRPGTCNKNFDFMLAVENLDVDCGFIVPLNETFNPGSLL